MLYEGDGWRHGHTAVTAILTGTTGLRNRRGQIDIRDEQFSTEEEFVVLQSADGGRIPVAGPAASTGAATEAPPIARWIEPAPGIISPCPKSPSRLLPPKRNSTKNIGDTPRDIETSLNHQCIGKS